MMMRTIKIAECLNRTTFAAFALSVLWTVSCSENVLAPLQPSRPSADTDKSTEDDSESNIPDTSMVSDNRIAFNVPGTAVADYLLIPTDSNELGAQGFWYYYVDEQTSELAMTLENGRICANGEIGPLRDYAPYAGIGLFLCYSSVYEPIPDKGHSLYECPFVENFQNVLAGISFELTGTIPENDSLKLLFKSAGKTLQTLPLSSPERGDYLFDNWTKQNSDTDMSFAELQVVEYQIVNEGSEPMAVSFCVDDFELLIY